MFLYRHIVFSDEVLGFSRSCACSYYLGGRRYERVPRASDRTHKSWRAHIPVQDRKNLTGTSALNESSTYNISRMWWSSGLSQVLNQTEAYADMTCGLEQTARLTSARAGACFSISA